MDCIALYALLEWLMNTRPSCETGESGCVKTPSCGWISPKSFEGVLGVSSRTLIPVRNEFVKPIGAAAYTRIEGCNLDVHVCDILRQNPDKTSKLTAGFTTSRVCGFRVRYMKLWSYSSVFTTWVLRGQVKSDWLIILRATCIHVSVSGFFRTWIFTFLLIICDTWGRASSVEAVNSKLNCHQSISGWPKKRDLSLLSNYNTCGLCRSARSDGLSSLPSLYVRIWNTGQDRKALVSSSMSPRNWSEESSPPSRLQMVL